jgi:Hint module
VTLTLASGRALTLSPRHFIPGAAGADGAWDARVAKGADEVRVGDFVWSAAGEGRMAVDEVVAVATRAAAGAYNPLTLNGTIVVDGVVASAHSDWFLDGVVPADTQARVYQAILAPVRVAYRAMGPAWMEAVIERWGVVDLVRESTTPGGRGASPAWALLALPILLGGGLLLRRRRRAAVH